MYIAHQINCVSAGASGLAKVLFKKYPQENIYKQGPKRVAGQAYVTEHLVHLAGENHYNLGGNETSQKREAWFKAALEDLNGKLPQGATILIPYDIGCGLAKGNLANYTKMLETWAAQARAQHGYRVYRIQYKIKQAIDTDKL